MMKIGECSECVSHLLDKYWLLREATASVALSREHASGRELMIEYMSRYHRDGHSIRRQE